MTNPIIIGFSRPIRNTALSWLIERGEGTPYDHVYIRFYSSSTDRWLVYQASSIMVNFMGWEHWKVKNEALEEYEVDATPEERLKILQFCIDEVGTPYGSKWLMGMMWIRLCRLVLGLTVHNPFPSGTTTFGCSKLAGYVLKLLGKGYDAAQLDDADPKWINQQISSWSRAVKLPVSGA